MPLFKKPAVQFLLIAAIGLFAYANTFQVPFVFDDETSIIDNPIIRNLGTFLDGSGYRYNPRRFVGYLSLALNYRLGGLEVTGYHLFNLAVHIGNACLVHALVSLTLAAPFFEDCRWGGENSGTDRETWPLLPLLAALLFVAHPVQTQAVTYIIQRLASLATLFYLLSLVLYLRGRLCRHPLGALPPIRAVILYGASFLSALLAMKTKEIAFTLPLVVLLYECFFFGTSVRKWFFLLLPVLLALLVVPLSLVGGKRTPGTLLSDVAQNARLDTDLPRLDYLFTQFRVVVTYLRLLVFPARQNLDYDYPVYHTFSATPVLLSSLLLAALLGLALRLFLVSRGAEGGVPDTSAPHPRSASSGQARLASFGILWFFITLSVESSVIPIADVIFEHRLYLPSVGACLAAAVFCSHLLRAYPGNFSRVGIAAAVLLLTALTWQRNEVWRDRLTLWTDVVGKSPEKARPHLNLGSELMRAGRTEQAIGHFSRATRIKPDFADAYANLAAAYNTMGMLDEAVEQCRIALRIDPDHADALNNAGTSFAMQGLPDYAIPYFQAALQLKPDSARYRHNLDLAYRSVGQPATPKGSTGTP